MVQERPNKTVGPTNLIARAFESFSPFVRFDSANPDYGFCGGISSTIITELNSKSSSISQTEDGQYHILVDDTVTLAGGMNKNNAKPSVVIVGKEGDVTITATGDGVVKIEAKRIVMNCTENMDLTTCKALNLKGNHIMLDAPSINTSAQNPGKFVLRDSFAQTAYKGLPFDPSNVASITGPLTNSMTSLADKLKEADIASQLEDMTGGLTDQLSDVASNIDTGAISSQLGNVASNIDTGAITSSLGNVGQSMGQLSIPGLGGFA